MFIIQILLKRLILLILNMMHIGKLETTPVDFSKLSDAGKNDIVKKTEYDELFKKVNNINTTDTSDFV